MIYDPLEAPGPLTEGDYKFLQGDEEYWPRWGAALSVTYEWCKSQGLGGFGQPTKHGLRKIEEYECQVEPG